MFTRRVPWQVFLASAVWLVGQPLLQELLRVAGVPFWVGGLLFFAGVVLLGVWVAAWLHRTAAPMRAQLERARQAHPGAVVELVALDAEWNPVEEPTVALVTADGDELVIENLLRVAAADIESVSVTHVTSRRQAIVIALPGSKWTFEVVATTWGALASARVVRATAGRIAHALGVD